MRIIFYIIILFGYTCFAQQVINYKGESINKMEQEEEIQRKKHYMSKISPDFELSDESQYALGFMSRGYSMPIETKERLFN